MISRIAHLKEKFGTAKASKRIEELGSQLTNECMFEHAIKTCDDFDLVEAAQVLDDLMVTKCGGQQFENQEQQEQEEMMNMEYNNNYDYNNNYENDPMMDNNNNNYDNNNYDNNNYGNNNNVNEFETKTPRREKYSDERGDLSYNDYDTTNVDIDNDDNAYNHEHTESRSKTNFFSKKKPIQSQSSNPTNSKKNDKQPTFKSPTAVVLPKKKGVLNPFSKTNKSPELSDDDPFNSCVSPHPKLRRTSTFAQEARTKKQHDRTIL